MASNEPFSLFTVRLARDTEESKYSYLSLDDWAAVIASSF